MKTFIKKYAFAIIPIFLCVLAVSFGPVLIFAQTPISTENPAPPISIEHPQTAPSGTFYLQNPLSSQFSTVGGLVGGFIQIFVYLVVLFAVIMIIYVGLMLVLAQGNKDELIKRKDQLLMLVIGLAIVIGARIIVQVVISTLQSTGTVNPTVITNAQNAAKLQ